MPHDTDKEIKACKMNLYPTKDSLVGALHDIEEAVGPELAPKMFPLVMAYHNTLLHELYPEASNDRSLPQDSSKVVSLNAFKHQKSRGIS